ncbi:MAG TPA: PAS domain S-box protein [Bryobacteraceae bacterium]|nr:PAS domain S-box protein [Bryobacteraceae bacterium]
MISTAQEPLRVLQIQRSRSRAESIVELLTRSGYRVEAARVQTAAEFIDALAAQNWDVAVSDCRLASFDATTALAILRAVHQDLPFIVVSGAVKEGVAAMRAGAHDFLRKDQFEQLPSAITREIRCAHGRRRAREDEEAERQIRDRVTLAMKATRLGIFDYRPQTDRLVVSGPLRDHYGIPPDTECSWRLFLRRIHPEERAFVRHAVIEAMRYPGSGKFFGEHRTIGHADGRPRSVIAWGNVFFDEAGTPVRFLGAARDVTSQKRAAESLHNQLQLTHRITQQSADSIFVLDEEGIVQYVNPAAVSAFGYSADEFLGRRLHELVHHHDADGRVFSYAECGNARARQNQENVQDREELFFHRDGTPIHVSYSRGPIEIDAIGSGIVLTVRNITERKTVEHALRESEARFRCLEEAGVVGTLITGEDGILYAGDRFIQMLGYTRDEFNSFASAGLRLAQLTAPEYRETTERLFRAGMETGSIAPYEKKLVRKDGGHIPVMLGAVASQYGGSPCMFSFVVDQSRVNNLEEQLHQAQKLESVGRLAGGIAHDFNNLLTVILGYSEMISSDFALKTRLTGIPAEPDMKARIDNITLAAIHGRGLIQQLLTFSRQKPAEPGLIRIDEVVIDIEQLLQRLIGDKNEIELALGAPATFVHADPGEIGRVLMNLATNARDAMPHGGTLSIATSSLEIDEFAALCFLTPPGKYVQLVVTDTGTGMEPEVAARIFDPFYTTKETGKGTGLGLATVYGIVKQSGGSISVHSAPGLGTTFRVLLPQAQRQIASSASEREEKAFDGSGTVLVVEDQAVVRDYVSEVLARRGYRVLAAGDYREGLAHAAEFDGPIHLLLTDFALPGGNGDALARSVARLRPEIRVIVMSGHAEWNAPYPGTGGPFLQKPFTAGELLKLVRKVLDSGAAAVSA